MVVCSLMKAISSSMLVLGGFGLVKQSPSKSTRALVLMIVEKDFVITGLGGSTVPESPDSILDLGF